MFQTLDLALPRPLAAAPLRQTRPQDRVFLFLQGLPGPFFARLGAALLTAGASIHRIDFNGGDRHDWPLPGALAFRGGAADWPGFLGDVIAAHGITDVILFGDSRPLHVAARRLCADAGIPVHVFEEGYLRPDFVTLERGGVNGHSPLPRSLAAMRAAAAILPPAADLAPVPSAFGRRARESATYYLWSLLAAPRFPRFRSHRPVPALAEGLGWLRRFARRGREDRRTAAALAAIAGRDYFVLPLQLDSDSQLRIHSSYGAMRPALDEVIASFARAAPAATLLLVKQHPLDPALTDWRRLTGDIAAAAGVADRVVVIERGDVGEIVRASRGLVTINSTTGTLALAAGVPVKVLGSAIYNIAGLTATVSLDRFWADPGTVDASAYDALRRVLVHRSLLHGGFHSEIGLGLLVKGAVTRLLEP